MSSFTTPADFRFVGGYSIILGSPATAESAGLANQIISGLGGANYDVAEHSLSVIKADQDLAKAVLDLVKTAVDAIKPRTDLIPDRPAQQITLEDMQMDLSSVKATVEAIEPTDVSGVPAAVWSHATRTLQKQSMAPNGWLVFEDTSNFSEHLDVYRASGTVTAESLIGSTLKFDFASNPAFVITTPVVTSVELLTGTRYRFNFGSELGSVAYAGMRMLGLIGSDYVATANQVTTLSSEVGVIKSDVAATLKAADYTAPDNTKIAQIKTKVDTLENTDVSGIPAAVRTELSTELDRIDVAVPTRSTLTAEDIPEGLTAAEVWSADTRTLTETAGLTPEQEATLNAIPTLAEIENSSAMAKEATTSAIRAKTDNLPPNPAAVGSVMALPAAYDAAKNAASQASVDAKPTLAQIEASTVLAKEESVQDVGDLVAGQ